MWSCYGHIGCAIPFNTVWKGLLTEKEFVRALWWDSGSYKSKPPLLHYVHLCNNLQTQSSSQHQLMAQCRPIVIYPQLLPCENDSWLYFIQTHAACMESGTLPVSACIHKSCSEYVSICFYGRTSHCLYFPQFSVAFHILAVIQIFSRGIYLLIDSLEKNRKCKDSCLLGFVSEHMPH